LEEAAQVGGKEALKKRGSGLFEKVRTTQGFI
jgi:hypothetical protein